MLSFVSIAAPFKERQDLLSFIKEMHRQRRGLSSEDVRGIAAAWGATMSEVYGIATFYSFIGTKTLGKNLVKVCRSTPCCMKHCGDVAGEVKKVLGISEGETTPDGRFSLMMVNCIGQCDGAPAMLVNDDVHQNMTVDKVRPVLERYSSGDMQVSEDA